LVGVAYCFHAHTILAYSSDIAQAVLAGSKLFDKALEEVEAKRLARANVAGDA
jgi:hypothetical protein